MMKETVLSMQVWFALVAVYTLLRSVFGMYVLLNTSHNWIEMTLLTLMFCLGAAFFYCCIKLPEQVQSSTKFTQTLIITVVVIQVIAFSLWVLVLNYSIWDVILPVVYVIINWCLLMNVRRLEQEHAIE